MSRASVISLRPAPGAPLFTLSIDRVDPETVVRARGELDRDTAPALIEQTDHLITAHSPRLLVLDLADVDYLGAAGISALLHVREALAQRGGRLILREPSAQVRTVLRLGRVVDLFDIAGTAGA